MINFYKIDTVFEKGGFSMEDNKVLSRNEKLERFLMPLGMVGVIFYLVHTILGNILWPEYNPITMDIS